MLQKMGNSFPVSHKPIPGSSYPAVIARALRTELGDSHRALKTIMLWTGVSERTAKNWFSGAVGPSGANLIELVRNSDSVYEVFFEQAGRQHAISIRKLMRSRTVIEDFLGHLDGLLAAPEDR